MLPEKNGLAILVLGHLIALALVRDQDIFFMSDFLWFMPHFSWRCKAAQTGMNTRRAIEGSASMPAVMLQVSTVGRGTQGSATHKRHAAACCHGRWPVVNAGEGVRLCLPDLLL
jgi:hypothetical protein